MKVRLTAVVVLVMLSLGMVSCLNDNDNPDTGSLLVKQMQEIDTYLASQGVGDRVLYDNNTGIRFLFHSYGQDIPPHSSQTVKITYTGKLFNDSTVTFASGQLNDQIENIKPEGLRYAVASMLEGTTATLYIPSQYGYGTQGATNVPADAILKYEVKLDDVVRTVSQADQFTADTTAIEKYLADNLITTAIKHPSGIRYTIQEQGTGATPNPYDKVSFKYKLSLLTSPGTVLQDSELTDQSVFGLVDGFKIGLQLMKVGTKATLYIPSGMGYGTGGSGNIPGNSNLIFEVTLTNVK